MRSRTKAEILRAREDYEAARHVESSAWERMPGQGSAHSPQYLAAIADRVAAHTVYTMFSSMIEILLDYLIDGAPPHAAAAFQELVWRLELDPAPGDVAGLLAHIPTVYLAEHAAHFPDDAPVMSELVRRITDG